MALDRTCNDLPYLVGRLTAKVEEVIGAENLPEAFAAKVQINALQKLPFWVSKALSVSDDAELVDLVSRIDGQYWYVDAKGQFFIGYYHQKGAGVRNEIGNRIAQLREKKGMTQKELAEKSGILQNNISRIEAGRYNVTLDTLAKLSAALGSKIELR
jgi:DNA-binding XRE family transcriptional regulator